jgi:hypothetical protein
MLNRFFWAGICFLFLGVQTAWGVEEKKDQTRKQVKPDKAEADAMEALIKLLKERGVMSEKEAAGFINRFKTASPVPRKKGKVIMIIPEDREQEAMAKITEQVTKDLKKDVKNVQNNVDYMSDELLRRSRLAEREREELRNKISDDVNNKLQKSSWAQRIRWGGDIRLRYQKDMFDENNADLLRPDDPNQLMNTKSDRERARYRLRLAVKAKIADKTPELNMGKVEVGARVTTGNDDDPVSTNETMGDYYNRDTVVIDRAFLKWTYSPELPWWGMIPQASITAGRIPNPWFFTDLVWDKDLNFEGLAVNYQSDTLMSNPWNTFFTFGAFPLQEVELYEQDKWLYAGQIGVEYKKAMGLSWKLGLGYYDFRRTTGQANDPARPNELDFTAPLYQQKGNTLLDIDPSGNILTALAAEYKELNITARLDYDYWFPVHIILTADYVKNLGFDSNDVSRLTGNPDVQEEDEGFMVGLKVGYPTIYDLSNWNVYLRYKHLEADAVIDAFTDSDFHLGGTNAQGWILGGEYGLFKNVWLSMKWISTDEISGPPLAIDTFQVDLNARF